MKSKLAIFAVATAGAIALSSCGGSGSQSEKSPVFITTINPGAKRVDPATAGSVSGTIRLDGPTAARKTINMAAVPTCLKARAGEPPLTEDVVPGVNGTLQNVVVYLKGDFNQYTFDVPQTPVALDQRGCQYRPHVVALMTGQRMEVSNSDMTGHNTHPIPKINPAWNRSQPPRAAPIEQSFGREEIAIPIKCNIHVWMKAYAAVLASPYFAVTGSDGAFELRNVAGQWEIPLSPWMRSYENYLESQAPTYLLKGGPCHVWSVVLLS